MWEYEFEEIHCDDGGGGYSLFGGIGWETLAHQEVILCRAAEGWRYTGFIPKRQRAGGYMDTIDLVFERERPET